MPAELDGIAARLAAVLGSDRPAAIVSQATTAHQTVVRSPIGSIATAARAARLEPPSTLVVGEVVNVLADLGELPAAERHTLAGALASPG
jgi:siroheme synthase